MLVALALLTLVPTKVIAGVNLPPPTVSNVTGLPAKLTGPVGSYYLQSGLANWRRSLGKVGKSSTGTGFGGVDVVFFGDSILAGGIAQSFLYDSAAQILKRKLQSKYNPIVNGTQVPGGYGFIPALCNEGSGLWSGVSSDVFTFSASGWTKVLQGSSGGVANRRAQATSASGAQARFVLDGTNANARGKRSQVTDVEFVAASGTGTGTFTYDVTATDVFPIAGTGTPTGTVSTTKSGSTIWGKHFGRTISGLVPAVINDITVSNPTGGDLYLDGIIAYNGDYDCGIRVHNVSEWGSKVSDFSASTLQANIDRWGDKSGGATNATLFVFNWITNDVGSGTGSAETISAYTAAYGAIIDEALGLASKPSVLIVIPPCPNATIYLTNGYSAFRDAAKNLAATRNNVAVIDLWEMTNNDLYSGTLTSLGWNSSDGVHYSSTFQEAFANILYDCLAY